MQTSEWRQAVRLQVRLQYPLEGALRQVRWRYITDHVRFLQVSHCKHNSVLYPLEIFNVEKYRDLEINVMRHSPVNLYTCVYIV